MGPADRWSNLSCPLVKLTTPSDLEGIREKLFNLKMGVKSESESCQLFAPIFLQNFEYS